MLLYNVLCCVLVTLISTNDILYPNASCKSSEYYNNIVLGCTALEPGYKMRKSELTCTSQHMRTKVENEVKFSCASCSLGDEMVSFFGDKCIKCPKTKVTSKGVCECDYKIEILVDTELTGALRRTPACVKCNKKEGLEPGDFDKHGIPRRCVKCVNSDCKCNTQAGYCFPENYFKNLAVSDIVEYNGIQPNKEIIKSKHLTENLLGVYGLCKANIVERRNNVTACQMLTNMCALLLSQKTTLSNTACKLLLDTTEYYQKTAKPSPSLMYNRPGWFDRIPWLFYDNTIKPSYIYGDNEKILTETPNQQFTLEKGLNTSILQLQVVSYSLKGEASSIKPVTKELSLCGKPPFTGFGTSFSSKCTISLDKLKTQTTALHELYLRVGNILHPVPVLVENNNLGTREKWVLTRRYFLVDNVLGVRQTDNALYVVRYAHKISLSVTVLHNDEKSGQIYVPLLRVSYQEVKNDHNLVKSVKTEFEIKYSKSGDKLAEQLGIAVGIMSFLGLVYAALQTISNRRRNNIVADCSCETLFSFVIFVCRGVSLFFFWALLGTTWYYLIIYKGQKAVSLFLPEKQGPVVSVLISTFVLSMISRIYLLHRTTNYDIFFVDWEKPKGKFIPTSTTTQEKETLTSVSIWRTYFLSNEWNELHTIRKINPTLQYLAFLFLTEFVGCKYLTTAQPDIFVKPASVSYVAEYSAILRIGLIFALFFALWVVQRFYNFLHERFVSDQLQMYIDLCSISNVSVVVLTDAVYGYYIHGRSVHGHADADMREIVSSLKREEDNLCSKRGLTADSDQQTFDMVVPYLLRSHYNRITQQVTSRDISQRHNQNIDVEKHIAAYSHINRLFSSFIDRSLDDIDYTVGEKLFLEHMLDMEIREPTPGKGILYEDRGQSFENVLFYGNEWLLFTWELVLVSMLDYVVTDFTCAVVIAWFINEVLLKKFSSWKCQRNVASKALIDDRFLI